ncbi:cobalt ECF transporter T component CbiQ [Candidatus Latescibacterota bacterium]
MHHLHIDRYAGIQSPVHDIDPRLKLLGALSFILMVVLTPEEWFLSYILYGVILLVLVVASQVPLMYILKRSVLILPFAVAVSLFIPFATPGSVIGDITVFGQTITITAEGVQRFSALNTKAFVSFVMSFLLVATTRFGDLMWAASKLGMPAKLVLVISFMYRYLFILLDKATHMKLARDLRSPRIKKTSFIAASGNIIGALFVRSFAHATALYDAMLLRGYDGKPSRYAVVHLQVTDIIAAAGFFLAAVTACFAGGWFHG